MKNIFQATEEEKHMQQLQRRTREKKPNNDKEKVRTLIEEKKEWMQS